VEKEHQITESGCLTVFNVNRLLLWYDPMGHRSRVFAALITVNVDSSEYTTFSQSATDQCFTLPAESQRLVHFHRQQQFYSKNPARHLQILLDSALDTVG
jgi:hypothetical protein